MTEETRNATMSGKIAAAVVKTAMLVKRLGKEGANEHGKYMYTSVDQFYEAVGPLMAENGLFIMADEIGSEVIVPERGAAQLNMAFNMFLVHESGDIYGPLKREVTVIAAGPQAYASAESFVTKYFIRNLFKVPTGEADADSDAKTDIAPARKAANKPANKPAEQQQAKQDQPANNADTQDETPAPAMSDSKRTLALEFVGKVNAFLDTNPSAAELFRFQGERDVNARMKRISSPEFSTLPAVADLLKRINAVYAAEAQDPETETMREPGEEG